MDTTLDRFTQDYIAAALTDFDIEVYCLDQENPAPIDKNYFFEDLAPETVEEIKDQCTKFQRFCDLSLTVYREKTGFSGGRDFWLTRNRHGAGYWDRNLGVVGDKLTEAAHVCKEYELYLGDDGKVYGSYD